MNSIEDTTNVPQADRLGDIEPAIRRRMRAELAELGLRRGSWRILRTLADHPASIEQLVAERSSDEEGRRGHGFRRGRSGHGHFGRGFDRRMAADFAEGTGRGFDRFGTDEERAAFIEGIRAHRQEVREARFQRGCTHHSDQWRGEHPHDDDNRGTQPHGGDNQAEHPHGEHHRGKNNPGGGTHGEHHRGGHNPGGHNPGGDTHGEHPHGDPRQHHDHHNGHAHHDRRDRMRAHRIQAALGDFAARGWVTFDDGAATLTDEGRKTYDAAAERIRALLASVAAEIK